MSRALGSGKLTKMKRGGGDATWVLDWRGANGVRRRQVLGADKRTAERQRAEIIRQRDLEIAGLSSVETQSKRLSELRDAYLPDLQARTAWSHSRNAKASINRMIDKLGDPKVRDLRTKDLIAIRLDRVARGAGHATVNREMTVFLGMLRWCARNGVISLNPITNLAPLPTGRGFVRRRRRALTDEEVERYIQAAHDDDRAVEARIAAELTIAHGTKGPTWNAKNRNTPRVPQAAMWRTLIETGARIGEVRCIEWADLDSERELATLRASTTKSGRMRVVPLRRALVEELLALRPIHERVLGRSLTANDKVFLTPDGCAWTGIASNALRVHRRILARAGIEERDAQGLVVDIHALRHTAATRFARSGVPITTTARILGHSDIQLTSRYYTHVDIGDLRAAIERVPRSAASRTRAG